MLYLYTMMMFAWDLDPDTHSHFRRYLDVFIDKRKISTSIKKLILKAKGNPLGIDPRVTGTTRLPTNPIIIDLRPCLSNGIDRIQWPQAEAGIKGSFDSIQSSSTTHKESPQRLHLVSLHGEAGRIKAGRIKTTDDDGRHIVSVCPLQNCPRTKCYRAVEYIHRPKYYHEGVTKEDILKGD